MTLARNLWLISAVDKFLVNAITSSAIHQTVIQRTFISDKIKIGRASCRERV
jgi:hypothetical protein